MQPIENAESQKKAILEKLEAATKDLLYTSETDAPLTPFFWATADDELTTAHLLVQAQLPAASPVQAQTLHEFFEPVASAEEWMNDDEKAEAKRFQDLRKILEDNLQNISVFRIGETSMDVFVVGKTEGGFAGVKTKVVET
jgi:hypothetical protein